MQIRVRTRALDSASNLSFESLEYMVIIVGPVSRTQVHKACWLLQWCSRRNQIASLLSWNSCSRQCAHCGVALTSLSTSRFMRKLSSERRSAMKSPVERAPRLTKLCQKPEVRRYFVRSDSEFASKVPGKHIRANILVLSDVLGQVQGQISNEPALDDGRGLTDNMRSVALEEWSQATQPISKSGGFHERATGWIAAHCFFLNAEAPTESSFTPRQ